MHLQIPAACSIRDTHARQGVMEKPIREVMGYEHGSIALENVADSQLQPETLFPFGERFGRQN